MLPQTSYKLGEGWRGREINRVSCRFWFGEGGGYVKPRMEELPGGGGGLGLGLGVCIH